MQIRTIPTVLGFCLAALALSADAQRDRDDESERRSDNCIWLRQLDRTEVLDDQTILFHQTNKRVYRNTLPRECPGLEREGRFLYEARTGQLCAVDMIAVLEDWGVGQLTRGFTCALGEFQRSSEEEVEELRQAAERRKAAESTRN